MKRISHSYFVCMEDFGKRGWEAVVSPETTRSGVVHLIAGGNLRDIVFIHAVNGMHIEDVTEELMAEAEALKERNGETDHDANRLARALFDGDHERDLRKHETV